MAPWIISLFSPSQDFSFEVELRQEAPCQVSDLHWGSSQYTLGPGHPLLFACGTLSSPGAITAQLKPSEAPCSASPFYTVCLFSSDFGRNPSTRGPGERWPRAHISARALGPRLFLFLFCLEFFVNIRAKIKHLLIW